MIDASREMTKDVLIKDARVNLAEYELCKWFVKEPVVYELSRKLMKKVHYRDDVFDIITWQVACAGADAITGLSDDDTPVRNSM